MDNKGPYHARLPDQNEFHHFEEVVRLPNLSSICGTAQKILLEETRLLSSRAARRVLLREHANYVDYIIIIITCIVLSMCQSPVMRSDSSGDIELKFDEEVSECLCLLAFNYVPLCWIVK